MQGTLSALLGPSHWLREISLPNKFVIIFGLG
jgi:hypothetical protein